MPTPAFSPDQLVQALSQTIPCAAIETALDKTGKHEQRTRPSMWHNGGQQSERDRHAIRPAFQQAEGARHKAAPFLRRKRQPQREGGGEDAQQGDAADARQRHGGDVPCFVCPGKPLPLDVPRPRFARPDKEEARCVAFCGAAPRPAM